MQGAHNQYEIPKSHVEVQWSWCIR